MARRREMVAAGGGLPYKKRLQYLTGDGTAYFVTDVKSADNVGVKLSAKPSSDQASFIFGVFGSNNRYGAGYNTGRLHYGWWNTSLGSFSYTQDVFLDYELNYKNSRVCKTGTNSESITATYNNADTEIAIFGVKRMDTKAVISPCAASIGDVYISQGTADIRHYIPVLSLNDTVEYYDLLTKTFATRSGTFTAGPEANGGGYKRKCVRRSYRRSLRPSARFCALPRWEVAA